MRVFLLKKDILLLLLYCVRYYFTNAVGRRVRSSVLCALCNVIIVVIIIIIIYTRPDLNPIYRACKYFLSPHRDTLV